MEAPQELADEPLEIASDAEDAHDAPLSAAERLRFDAAYRAHRDALLRLLRQRVGNEEDAADLMQEAYLRLLRYRCDGPDSLRALLFRVALNLAVSHARRAYIRCDVSLDGFDPADERAAPDDELMREQLLRQVTEAIGKLPPRCREMFLLSRIHGLRQREIARRCGVSSRAVEKQMTHARHLLRAQFREAVA